MRIKITIEYNGASYCGWQRQDNAISVQQKIEEALQKVAGKFITLTGASRTDAGVHALGQVAHFDMESSIPPEKFAYVLNTILPDDIRIIKSEAVTEDFHARFCTKAKQYRYIVYNSAHASAVYDNIVFHVRKILDIDAMRRAAECFIGTHDFNAFMATGSSVKDTVRTIYYSDIQQTGPFIVFNVAGNGFLYNMVRIIAGTLVDVGKGKLQADSIASILSGKARIHAGPTAPAQGLMLVKIFYEDFTPEGICKTDLFQAL